MKTPFVDSNNFIHNPTQYHVVDANGKVTYSSKPTPKKKQTPRKQEKPVKRATRKDLEKLEDAIFNNKEFRVIFLNDLQRNTVAWKSFLFSIKSRRLKTLQMCWEVKNWRPSPSGRKVLVRSPENPYLV